MANTYSFDKDLIIALDIGGEIKSHERRFVKRIFEVKYRKTQKDGLYRGRFEEVPLP